MDNFRFKLLQIIGYHKHGQAARFFSPTLFRKPFSVELEKKTRVGFHVGLIRGGGKG